MASSSDEHIRVADGPAIDGLVRETFFRSPGFVYGAATSPIVMPALDMIFTRPDFLPTRKVLVTRAELVARLNRIAGFVEKTSPSVKISLKGSLLTLSTASEEGDCVEPLEAIYSEDSQLPESQEEVSLSVSNAFLSKVLSSIESEVITLGLRNELSPLIVSDERNDEINTRYVVMSVRPKLEVREDGAVVSAALPKAAAEAVVAEAATAAASGDDSFLEDDDLEEDDDENIPDGTVIGVQ